jgi:hypothetical protein
MSRSPFLFGLVVVPLAAATAQNLVPNPGFDNFLTCPVGFSQFQGYVASWVNPNTATPDYMHACANPNPAGMPHNGVGWQQTHTGQGYAGMYAFSGTLYREFIQVQLTTPLVGGVLYDFRMFVVLHNPRKRPSMIWAPTCRSPRQRQQVPACWLVLLSRRSSIRSAW